MESTMKKENIKYIVLILFFLFILFLSPISGDDWGNYIEGSQGIRHVFGNAIGMYFDWEGRFISRILINILTYHKVLWNIINSLMIVGIIYYTVKIINPRNKKLIFILSTLTIFMMNIFTFSQVVVWVAGNITYLFVIPMMLYYFYNLLQNKKQTKLTIIINILLNMIMPMFIEHMAVALVVGNILILAYKYIKNKKLDKYILIYLLLSIISLLTMLLSPGSIKRSKIETQAIESYVKLQETIINQLLQEYSEQLEDQKEEDSNGLAKAERRNRYKKALDELTTLISAGAEFHPSLTAAQEIIDEFPKFDRQVEFKTPIADLPRNKEDDHASLISPKEDDTQTK
mgnify:CR=1 FL=1